MPERPDLIIAAAEIWEQKAAFWFDYMGPEGNAFYREVVAPAQLRLLQLRPGERVLDVACGGGQFARAMARLGAQVVACDVSPTFVERAQAQSASEGLPEIEFHVVDATDEAALIALGGPFDAVVCAMAIMDLPVVEPLLRATFELLRPGGRFVVTVMHPAFFSTRARQVEEQFDTNGEVSVERAIKVTAYLDVPVEKGAGVPGEPQPHYYFHRPIARLLSTCFDAGFVLDGMEEPAFEGAGDANVAFAWRNYAQFPPVLVCRLRR
jgi:SAM-dependent methyltransferase